MDSVYDKIESYISSKGMYKIDLCRQIGMTANGYAEMEKRNSLKLSTLIEIARTLKVSLADLLEGEITESLNNVPNGETQPSQNTSALHTIKPHLLEQESIDAIVKLPIGEEEKRVLLSERIGLLQLHLKIAIEKNIQQAQQIEKMQREIERLVK
jgi:DNA-binding Xre family transcriptional regulator